MRRSAKRLLAEKCLKQGLKKKNPKIPAYRLDKQFSHFACLGPPLARLVLVMFLLWVQLRMQTFRQGGWGAGYPEPELTRGWGAVSKNFSALLRASV